jgi:flagellar biosynthesis chaperone FliJ
MKNKKRGDCMEAMKWNHLNERDISNAKARREATEQRVIDEVALTRFAYRKTM